MELCLYIFSESVLAQKNENKSLLGNKTFFLNFVFGALIVATFGFDFPYLSSIKFLFDNS